MSLKDCIAIGLQNHLSEKIHENNIEKAKQSARENIALYLPQVYGDAAVENFLKQQTLIIPEGIFGPEIHEIQFGTKFSTNASVTLEQALFDRNLLAGFRGLKPAFQSAQIAHKMNQEQLIYNISIAYIQVYVLKEQLKLLDVNLKKFQTLKDIADLQFQQGVAKKTDADRVFVALSNTQSQFQLAESGYQLALNRLKNAMGIELSQQLELPDTFTIPQELLPLDAAKTFDVGEKSEIQIQKRNLLLLQVQKNRTSGNYFPRLSFFARYGAQSYSEEFRKMFDQWYDYSSLGLKLQVPIFDGLQKRAQVYQARINLENAEYNLALNEDAFQLQYQNALVQLNRSKSNLENTQLAVNLAGDVFESGDLQYRNGVITLTELLTMETLFKESQSNYITSVFNYYTSILDFEKAKGTLFNFYDRLPEQ